MIVGAGKGGSAILKILLETAVLEVVAVVDHHTFAPGISLAKQHGIKVGKNWRTFLTEEIDIVIEVTGDDQVFKQIRDACSKKTLLIPGSVAFLLAQLINEKEELIKKIEYEKNQRELIFETTGDGMIGINQQERIILFNRSAERMIGISKQEAIGAHVLEIIPTSRLPNVLSTGRKEMNQPLVLFNGLKIITSRMPVFDENGEKVGAFAVFKDITEVVNLAEEITNLKEIQTLLEAIIQSSDDAISVVDEHGRGMLINRAYTRMTGLKKEEVIGQPATADISEGESMHLKVLKTKQPVRGVAMRVGAKKKEVIVNVAPVIVDGKLKGSVGVIHDVSEIKKLTNELTKARQMIRTLEAKYTFEDIIGQSKEMRLSIDQAKLAAKTPATILLRGESGTGKELFAHAIHHESDRRFYKFIRVNCAALSESLLESELFGYEEGAFSGAKQGGKRGLFEEANQGSIFLDEIGELSISTQAKLLRVLQENEIIRVGGTKPIPINVRIIAATNVHLEKAITEGAFREDLYHRLNRMPIYIPPLKARKEDIRPLCIRLIEKINQDYGRNVTGITEAALQKLLHYDWPGNVRELENILGRAMIFMNYQESDIDIEHLPFLETDDLSKESNDFLQEEQIKVNPQPLAQQLAQYERALIEKTLIENKGNKTQTAKDLAISIRNLYYKMEKLGIYANNSLQ